MNLTSSSLPVLLSLEYPLLYGSLGFEKRLSINLNADDIDVLIPEKYIKSDWNKLIDLMNKEKRLLKEQKKKTMI